MSTPTPHQPGINPVQPPPVAVAPVAVVQTPVIPAHKRQVIVVSHSNLFYWWPVWAVGFLMTILSFFGDRMAVVPAHTEAKPRMQIEVDGKKETRHLLVLPATAQEPQAPRLHIARDKNVGVVFCAVLLLVIAITNVPLRGLWSFLVIISVLFITIILAILHKWEVIFEYLSYLDIRISMGGYFFISSVLFVLWFIVLFFFDQQIYMIFEPGQLRVRQSVGEGETSYDTTGMTTPKQRG